MKISLVVMFLTARGAQSFVGSTMGLRQRPSIQLNRSRILSSSNIALHTKIKSSEINEAEISSSSTTTIEILTLVFPLLFIYISNQWSRYSISYLVDFSTPLDNIDAAANKAMNIDLQFTEVQYGILASTAFTALFALTSLVAGDLADRYNRKVLTIISCIVWSLATLYMSYAHTYNEVLIARIVQGGACAFQLVGYTLIADGVSKDKKAFANGLYGSAIYLGGALSSLSILLDERVGWRATLMTVSGYGILCAVLGSILIPSDDNRDLKNNHATKQQSAEVEEQSLIENVVEILSIPRMKYLFLASFLRLCAGLCIGIWKAPYFKEAYPLHAGEFALLNAFIMSVVGGGSGILGGYVADSLGAWIKDAKVTSSSSLRMISDTFDEQTIRLMLPIVGSLLAIPTWYYTINNTGTFEYAMIWLSIEYLVAECWFGPVIAVLQSTVGTEKTGTAQGMFVLTGALANAAPTLLGYLYGSMATGTSNAREAQVLGNLLTYGVILGYVLSAIFFVMSVRASDTTNKLKTI